MGKTVGELLHGDYPLSAYEYSEWVHLFEMEADAAERAQKG